ncbi:MAG: outer membrane lipoprotein-sorting protein [Pseudomonadota bacterium]
MSKLRPLAIAIFALSTLVSSAGRADAIDEAFLIANRVVNRLVGDDSITKGLMTIETKSGRVRERELLTYQLNAPQGRRSLMLFTSPANIEATSLLVHDDDDAIWLYLPALNRTRRISSSNRGGRFVQSHLYYEDLQERPPSLDAHKILRKEVIFGTETIVLESVPKIESSSTYSRRISWIHPDLDLPLQVDFYRADDSQPVKRLKVRRVEQISGYWTVTEMTITDLKSDLKTTIIAENTCYNVGLNPEVFSSISMGNADYPQGCEDGVAQ